MKPSDNTPSFEHSLARLETLVTQMEQGDLPIDQALALFEEGVRLTRECQQILDQAEQKVQLLMANGDELESRPFHDSESDAS